MIGTFGECETTVTTTPKDGSGGDIPADGLSIGTGTVAAKDAATIAVSGISVWDGSLQFHICGPIASPATCDGDGVPIGSAIAVDEATSQPVLSDAATLTSAGRYCWRAEFTSATEGVPDASENFVPKDSATITVTSGAGGDLAGTWCSSCSSTTTTAARPRTTPAAPSTSPRVVEAGPRGPS